MKGRNAAPTKTREFGKRVEKEKRGRRWEEGERGRREESIEEANRKELPVNLSGINLTAERLFNGRFDTLGRTRDV